MRSTYKRFAAAFAAALLIFSGYEKPVRAAETAPYVTAETAVLIEAESGKVLYGKDEHKKMFPASMTKILTAMIVLDILDPAELVTVGKEIHNAPGDSSMAGLSEGEVVTVENLLRGLLIMSGNETACTLALAAARQASGDAAMGYQMAERYFCDLMNSKARELGALNSNFVNPHGYHHDNMYSTAYDIAVISREALKYDLIRRISAETTFSGNGAGQTPDPSMKTKNYNWTTHNELLVPGTYYYPYATGIKTGKTSNAGDCLAASAEKEDTLLITVVCNSPSPARWTDTIAMFDYGFDNFSKQIIYGAWSVVGELPVYNPRLQEPIVMEYLITEDVGGYLSNDELLRVTADISFLPELIITDPDKDKSEGTPPGSPRLVTPVKDGQILGTIDFSVDGATLYSGYIIASRDALERTFSSNADYYINNIKEALFSKESLPYWGAGVLITALLAYIIIRLLSRRRRSIFSSGRKFY